MAPSKKSAAKKSPAATKAAATKSAAKKTPAKKTPAKKTPAKKTPAKKSAAKKTPATKSAATKTAAKRAPASVLPEATAPPDLTVGDDEAPWTTAEIALVRDELVSEVERLRAELDLADAEIADLVRDAGDGAGEDQADSGSKAFDREHEMTIANNTRDLLTQNAHALARIADGSYGVCESCGRPVGKRRLQAFPRATLCMECKRRQERH